MTNTIDKLNRANPFSLDFLKILLRGTGQVMFQNNVWTGLLFFIGIFWGAYAEKAGVVAWGALLGVGVSTLTGYLLGLPEREGRRGSGASTACWWDAPSPRSWATRCGCGWR